MDTDIKIAGGLTLVMFKYEYDKNDTGVCLDEKEDQNLFHPDGVTIAYVLSNFCNEYHPDYYNLSKEFIEDNKQKFKEHNNNRGRKKKENKKKNKKKDNGTNTEFGSCITFGVIMDGRIHGIKMFRVNSGNISKLTHEDIISPDYIPRLVNKLFDFINTYKPLNIRYVSFYVALANITSSYPLNGKIINLYMLREKLNLGMYTPAFWGCYNAVPDFNGKKNHLKITLREYKDVDRTSNIKLTPEGKIHIYGSKDYARCEVYMRLLFTIINNHKDDDYVIIKGVRAAVKPKNRPDFTKTLKY